MIKGWGIFFLILDALYCIGWGSTYWIMHRCTTSMSGTIFSSLFEVIGVLLGGIFSLVFYLPLHALVHRDLIFVIILGVIGVVCTLLPADD